MFIMKYLFHTTKAKFNSKRARNIKSHSDILETVTIHGTSPYDSLDLRSLSKYDAYKLS